MNDNDLNELDAIFNEIGNDKAEEVANDFGNIEDGEYEAEVVNAEYKHSKNDKPMICIEYGLEGGKHHWQYLMLVGKDEAGTKRNIATAVTTLRKFGLDSESITGYVSQLDKLEGKAVTLTITTKNDFQRTSVEVH